MLTPELSAPLKNHGMIRYVSPEDKARIELWKAIALVVAPSSMLVSMVMYAIYRREIHPDR